jgi:hypothetical protein
LYHKTSGRMYEVLAVDTTTGMGTLKNEMATFTDTLDPEKLRVRGYIRVSGEDEADARAKGEAKVAAEAAEAAEEGEAA